MSRTAEERQAQDTAAQEQQANLQQAELKKRNLQQLRNNLLAALEAEFGKEKVSDFSLQERAQGTPTWATVEAAATDDNDTTAITPSPEGNRFELDEKCFKITANIDGKPVSATIDNRNPDMPMVHVDAKNEQSIIMGLHAMKQAGYKTISFPENVSAEDREAISKVVEDKFKNDFEIKPDTKMDKMPDWYQTQHKTNEPAAEQHDEQTAARSVVPTPSPMRTT